MNTTDEQYRSLLTKFESLQIDSEIGRTKCPRCRRDAMKSDVALNALSRYINIYLQ